jgi:hypothetical protein
MGGAPTDIGLFSPAIVHSEGNHSSQEMTAIVAVYRMIL